MYKNTRDQNPSYLVEASDVEWGVVFYSSEGFDSANELTEGTFNTFNPKTNDMAAFKQGSSWKPGYYKVEGIASKYGARTTVKVVITNSQEFFNGHVDMATGFTTDLAIDDITIRAGRTLPDSITVLKASDASTK